MNNIVRFAATFLVVYIILALVFNTEKPNYPNNKVFASFESTKISYDTNPLLYLKNPTDQVFIINKLCNSDLFFDRDHQKFTEVAANCSQNIKIKSKDKYAIPLTDFTEQLRSAGNYFVKFSVNQQEFKAQFTRKKQGFFNQIWTALLVRPMMNTLVFLVDSLPGHSFGFAIIILTILIRLLLLAPNHKALESQRKMQLIQPKLQEIQSKFAGNREKIAKETMALFKKNKVNPASGCIPILIQFPILIALYFVFLDGLSVSKTYLLYPNYQNFDFTEINTVFLNILDLTSNHIIVLAIIIASLQFVQMKLALKKIAKPAKKDKNKAPKNISESIQESMKNVSQTMVYILPFMIAVFVWMLPAAVGLYWGVSTLFGIAQQFYVNKLHTTARV